MPPHKQNVALREHDHSRCVDNAIATAKQLCANRDVKLTPLREQVLELVWHSHKPLGAYAILDLLAAQTPTKKRQAPPTVYRALEFLQQQGLVHRINSLNAFIGCSQPHAYHNSHFLICRQCETALEIADENIAKAAQEIAQKSRFSDLLTCIEITGLCPNCARTLQ